MRLIESLESKKSGATVAERPLGVALADHVRVRVRETAQLKLARTRDLFPLYTDHSVKHSDGVVVILDWLVPDSIKDQLNEWEIYFLLCAAYLHDLGMIQECPPLEEDLQWKVYKDSFIPQHPAANKSRTEIEREAARDFVREHHHERSERYIRENAASLNLMFSHTSAEASIVARISKGHRKVDLSDAAQYGTIPFGTNNQQIHRQLLAAYLRLADELDTTAHRTPIAEYEILKIDDEVSALEWEKHLSIWGVSEFEDSIVLSGECRDHKVHLRLLRLQKDIQSKLSEIRQMLPSDYLTNGQKPFSNAFPYRDVKLQIETLGFLPIEVCFKLDQNKVFEILMGERIYQDKSACLRELLQNAVDACHQAALLRPPSYRAEIEVIEGSDCDVITVSDNGTGMNEHIIREYFSRIGSSYYHSNEFAREFRPISEFGIGILSCFMIADRIEIETKMDGADPIWFEISSLSEPFYCRRGARFSSGTKISLHLKPSAPRWNLIEQIQFHARKVDIPIQVTRGNGYSAAVDSSQSLCGLQDYFEVADIDVYHDLDPSKRGKALRAEAKRAEERFLGWTRADEGVDLTAVFFPGGALYTPARHTNPKRVIGSLNQDGFFVRDLLQSDIPLARGSFVEVNLSGPSRVQLSVDRNRTLPTQVAVLQSLDQHYFEAFRAAFQKKLSKSSSERWWSYHAAHFHVTHKAVNGGPLREALLSAKFCVLDKDGFHIEDASAIRARPIHYLADLRDHGMFGVISNRLPPDTSIVFAPRLRFEWQNNEETEEDNLSIALSSLFGDQPKYLNVVSLLKLLGIPYWETTIGGEEVWLVDAGLRFGPPAIPWSMLSDKSGMVGILWDIHHPITQTMVKLTDRDLPRWAVTSVGQFIHLVRMFYGDFSSLLVRSYDDDLIDWFTKTFEDFVNAGLLAPSDVPPPSLLNGGETQPHLCPYGPNAYVVVSASDGSTWK